MNRGLRLAGVWLLLMLALAGCAVANPGTETGEATPTPIPTTDPDEGLRVITAPACLAGSFPSIQVDKPAGDMMAWSPEGDRLAYVAPVNNRWGWYTGNLTLLSLETGETRATRDIKVAGDLTWSPDSTRIAMRALLGTENIYTVLVLQTSDFSTLDLFPAGSGTDDFASEKGILEWTDTSRIQVVVSCGVDCTRVVEINLVGQQQRLISEGRKQEDHSLEVALNQTGVTINPKWLMANASPDRSLIFYVDQNGQAWLASPEAGTKYRLELDLGEVQESKWSPDSRLLAVRTNEMIFLYDLECSLNWPE